MFNRWWRALVGAVTMLRRVSFFEASTVFNNKRVAVVGAADSALKKENGEYIDSFDYVIRLNKALFTAKPEQKAFIGQRSDILVHSFYENTDRGGGGPLDWNIFTAAGVQYLIHPRNNREGWRVIFNYFKKYPGAPVVYIFPSKVYREIDKLFNPWKPTMGFCALYMLLKSPCKEIFITGFTFFKTPYSVGYRDHLLDMNANAQHIQQQGQHDPDLEYTCFKKLLTEANPGIRVYLDEQLYAILEADNFPFTSNISKQ